MTELKVGQSNPAPQDDVPRGSSLAVSAAGETRIGPLMALPTVLEEFGVAPVRAFRQAGIEPCLFDNSENRIAYESLGRLLWACTTLTDRDDFGLQAGSRFTLGNFGALGDLMRNAASVGESLRMLILHLHFYDRAAVPVMLRMDSAAVFLGYSLQHATMPGAGQLQDAAIAVAYRMLRELCGPRWRPRFVQFSHHRPENIASYRRVFGPGVRFDAELSGISFSASWLEHRIAGADPALHGLLHRALQDAESGRPMSVAEEVQCVLLQLLPGGTASSVSVARLFGISERTLRLRLQAEGTSMQRLLAATRLELARHLLQNTHLPLSQIAAALCYADSAVFSRAFRGWAGVSPRQWRADSRLTPQPH
jgi:AraC-like DNA-binding protein